MRTAREWNSILLACGVKPSVAAQWSEVFADTVKVDSFSQGDAELDDFLGQILHESAGLTRLEDGLNYSAERLTVIWPGRFPTANDARPYAHNPEALANRVYGGRMGNTEPGDGWRFRGRGPIQLTGRANYEFVGNLIGQDLTVTPELMGQPRYARGAAIAWWEDRILDNKTGAPEKVTRRVNGGLIGLAHREDLTDAAREALT